MKNKRKAVFDNLPCAKTGQKVIASAERSKNKSKTRSPTQLLDKTTRRQKENTPKKNPDFLYIVIE